MRRIAIFASGSGTNAEKIIEYFTYLTHRTPANKLISGSPSLDIDISLLLSNNPKAEVIARARRLHIPVVLFDRSLFYTTGRIVELLQRQSIDLIVLAGFMWLVPENLIRAFSNRIINIHPALLPKYGGKGMYGHFVHEAVVAANEQVSGITIHYVNEQYDKGDIIFQVSCPLDPTDTPEDVARKVQLLEHRHYPEVIKNLLNHE